MVTNLNLLYVSSFFTLLFLSQFCSNANTKTAKNIKNNKLTEKEEYSVGKTNEKIYGQNPTFGLQEHKNHAEDFKECNCPAKFSKHIQIINFLEPIEDDVQEIAVKKDENSPSGKPKNKSKRTEFKRKIADNFFSYCNKDADLLNKIYDRILTKYSDNIIVSEGKMNDTSNEGDKITLMQLENENTESMSRQFRENQRKTKPYLIIHTNKIYPTNLNHNFVKRSTVPQLVPYFDDYGMMISPSEEEAELDDGYANHALWIEKAARKVRSSKLFLKSDQESIKNEINDLNSGVRNNLIVTKLNDRRSSKNKHCLVKKAKNYSPSDKLNVSDPINMNENYKLAHQIPAFSYDNADNQGKVFTIHSRNKHQLNLNKEESGYFSSDVVLLPDKEETNFRQYNGSVIANGRKRNRKVKNRYNHSWPRFKENKLHRFNGGNLHHKKISARFKNNLQKNDNSFNNRPHHLSNKNEEVNNSRETKDMWNKLNFFSTHKNNGENYINTALNKNTMYDKTLDKKLANIVDDNRVYRSYSNASLVADEKGTCHNNHDSADQNIAGELTPVYSIPCERICEYTTPDCKSTRRCFCKFTFPQNK
ncbi:uncharacterized protein isoform X1 [Rhodnius prolixus]|uniref:uncharacterized protein isoform X1 n=1 Tax=Rhodnius prolixus TaxID=13249 RepID=UPI003D18D0BD